MIRELNQNEPMQAAQPLATAYLEKKKERVAQIWQTKGNVSNPGRAYLVGQDLSL